ncbi:hypothetical protein [Mastigocoleus testarum]|uniref:Uncharacterized protein n=1 Tax=Mastigocoleus testarum BC008 TaxID=371196 RepID=A0A0V7ZZG0_9CYAN|nr:hypothetical protein [Mastigocoleus testarum]KST69913.1 hypothetical protein BC008_05605 [Mastigocoleus testarum BC008]KST69970.1 hypothetical protein BC008_05905 [Mastigocoleus testarum BC008]
MENEMRLLYLGWSEERKDTKTQVGKNFESTYTYGPWLLGMIWSQPEEGMIPLYECWSNERKDSRLSTKPSSCEAIYNQEPRLQGYIYKDKTDSNMIPLYQCWSDSRKDTRTYTDPSAHEAVYNHGPEILGYIRPVETLKMVDFDNDSKLIALENQSLKAIAQMVEEIRERDRVQATKSKLVYRQRLNNISSSSPVHLYIGR